MRPANRACCRPGLVETILQDADQDGVLPPWWPGEPPAADVNWVGRDVRVRTGPWAGWVGKCVQGNKDRVSLLLGLFGREVTVWARANNVEDASS